MTHSEQSMPEAFDPALERRLHGPAPTHSAAALAFVDSLHGRFDDADEAHHSAAEAYEASAPVAALRVCVTALRRLKVDAEMTGRGWARDTASDALAAVDGLGQ